MNSSELEDTQTHLVVLRFRLEWWKKTSGALMSSQCHNYETAWHRFEELRANPEVVEVRVIREEMILQHINGNGSCGDIQPD